MSYEDVRHSCVVFDLSARGKIEAKGTEVRTFLHNLSSNDIKSLSPGKGCETFFCNATARVLAYGWVWQVPSEDKGEVFWLDLDPGLGSSAFHHLDRHLISEDVILTDQTSDYAQWHLVGPRASEVLASAGISMRSWHRGECSMMHGVHLRMVDPLGLAGFDLVVSARERSNWQEKLLAAGALLGDETLFEVLRVEAGTPRFAADMDESTFAPEVNRTPQAISYHKGCYLGQEPIVMARDRGVVQRALMGVRLPEAVSAGSLLFREGKEVGRTTSVAVSPRFGAIAMAYLRRGNQTPGTIVEVEHRGTRLPATVSALPFSEE